MKYLVLIGRILYAFIFISAGFTKFSGETIAFAASQGVPMASFLVPAAGVMAILGGASIAFGYKAKWGALLLIGFLIPVTFAMHQFWTVTDPMMAQIQQVMFIKNISMVGAALLIAYFGSGPLSLDNRIGKPVLREGLA